jgi:hypothetical protein
MCAQFIRELAAKATFTGFKNLILNGEYYFRLPTALQEINKKWS